MRILAGTLLHSASDLANFLDCPHRTSLDLQALLDPAHAPKRAGDSEEAALVQAHGFAHEARYLATLKASGRQVTEIQSGPRELDRAVAETQAAMQRGDEVIYQAALHGDVFAGHADFLIRVPGDSALGPWHYEVADTKLARAPKAKFLIQLSFYADLLADIQGRFPERVHLHFGDGGERAFRSADYLAYFKTLRTRYLDFVEQSPQETYPDPVPACGLCPWREACESRRLADDHLSQVANISRVQIDRLQEAGITTLASLAKLPESATVPRMHSDTLDRLRQQARLQLFKRETGSDRYERLPEAPQRGFARLPQPDPGDLFFDMEGDPYEAGGLEYLFGVGVLERGKFEFHDFWAHSRSEERQAFEAFIDFAMARLKRHPQAHIYHYAAYEETALKRLMSLHGTREAEVDHLLRTGKLVDLYKVVREGLRVSEPRYSIKNLETFYADKRAGEVKSAGASIVWYERWRETGDRQLLDDIRAYNEDDCRSTWQLRDWLLSLRPAHLAWWVPATSDDSTDTRKPWEHELAEYRKALLGSYPEDREQWPPEARVRELAYQLLDFYRREAKPQWWALFARMEQSEEELLEDIECLAGLTLDPEHPPQPDKRSVIYTYRYPEQESKLKRGDSVTNALTGEPLNEVTLDEVNRRAILRVVAKRPQPERLALGPGQPYSTEDQQAALRRFADSLIEGDARYPAIEAVLRRELPRLKGRKPGRPIIRDDARLLAETIAAVAALDHSDLFIQGPPGAGKTYTGSHVIVDMLKRGKRVAIASNSHKAIHNLLAAVEDVAEKQGIAFQGVKKASARNPESFYAGRVIRNATTADEINGGDQLVAGTAWLFSKSDFDQSFDYLFVDEAGQVALANLVALGTCARNLVLLGDPMQLGQPTQGVHPGDSGLSGLEYLLDGRATVTPEAGIFLPTSWRMAPAVCQFISDAVYDSRLHPEPDNVRQTLVLGKHPDPALQASGIRFLPIVHSGNSQRSEEEAQRIRVLYDDLLKHHHIDRKGQKHRLSSQDILVVAPYNLQVNLLRQMLPEGARVGTVDKFQGQEAPVVIVSMATSSEDYLPRDIGFLFSKNRLNVAISRAKCLAIVVASPDLLAVKCHTVEQMALVNLLCRVAEYE
ncbi:MAG: TM0106 family RecB-like putative nuclease [Pseudomonadota bacterium]